MTIPTLPHPIRWIRNKWSDDEEGNTPYRVMSSSRRHAGIVLYDVKVVSVHLFVDGLAVGINILTPGKVVVRIDVHVFITIIVNA